MERSMTKPTMLIKQCPPEWYVLLWDGRYNAQHMGRKVATKTPIECWVYDPSGEKPPIPYGHVQAGKWCELNKKVCAIGNDTEELVPLAFDGILNPRGEVIDPDGNWFESVESWFGVSDDMPIQLVLIEGPGTRGVPGGATAPAQQELIPF